jgi:hypothetical protein
MLPMVPAFAGSHGYAIALAVLCSSAFSCLRIRACCNVTMCLAGPVSKHLSSSGTSPVTAGLVLEDGTDCSETSASKYQCTLHKSPKGACVMHDVHWVTELHANRSKEAALFIGTPRIHLDMS